MNTISPTEATKGRQPLTRRVATWMRNMVIARPLSAGALMAWVVALFYIKFLVFDIIWACDTTFSGFQFPIGYLTKLVLAGVLALPVLAIRSRWYVLTAGLVIDLWLIANLMYFRTYFTVIPASSYGLVSNLSDFQDSVWESLRLVDIIFPLTTAWVMVITRKTDYRRVLKTAWRRLLKIMILVIAVPLVVVIGHITIKGGYKAAYEDLMYDFSTCGAAVYTIPGAMTYEFYCGRVELTPELRTTIETWLDERPTPSPFVTDSTRPRPDNCIILLLESFESWPLNQVIEGQEITPNLNRLIADTTTFYAPYIYNQVKGARSIDAQLILHTGLLPVKYGAYSYRFVHNTYPSLDKAWIENHGPEARAMSFTVDKRTVWNVAVVAQDFGYELYDKPNFVLDVKTGPRGRLGDDSFMRQVYAKLSDTSLFAPGGHTLAQLVTYSGHTPFVIPDELKKVHFSDRVPERLRHYLEVANYTDRAIGEFLDSLRHNPKFANTMVVITGDHEGIGTDRNGFLRDPEVKKYLSDGQYVPLIVSGGPVGGRYDGVAGQVDIFPTLLDMLGLDYHWRGLGQSMLEATRPPMAVTPQNKIVGDASSMTDDQVKHARRVFDISDLIITSDYFKHAQ